MYFDDVQTRLVILYALKKFKIAMSEELLCKSLVWGGIIDYFTMMDFLIDMEKSEMTAETAIDGKRCYDITDKGLQMVDTLAYKIPYIARESIDDAAFDTLDELKRGPEIAADIVPVDYKNFLAKCGIYDRGMPLMEISLLAGSRQAAFKISEQFKKDAADLYKTILGKLEKVVE